jgi:arsenite oxidase small subunit
VTTEDSDDEKAPVTAGSSQPRPAASRSAENARRNFLKAGLAFAVVLVAAGIAAVAGSLISPPNPPQAEEVVPASPPQTTTVTETVTGAGTSQVGPQTTSTSATSTSTSAPSPFPRLMVANISDVSEDKAIFFNYPLDNEPSILVKLGTKGVGGVGPDGDIVAFSQVCQHLGCDIGFVAAGGSPVCDSSYKAEVPVGYCCCHGSVYDLTASGKVIAGPSPRPAPQVTLEFDASTGDIYAVGMGPPTIFGHDTGSNDVLNDLQGGTPVG